MKKTLPSRIDAILRGKKMPYDVLAEQLWPPAQHPRAWRCSSNGGPPGCYMALSRALREGGFYWSVKGGPSGRIVHPRGAGDVAR